MAVYNVTLNLTQAGTNIFQDVAAGDTVNITVNTIGGATWDLYNTSGVATASIFSGSSGSVCSITFNSSSTYIASFFASYFPPKSFDPVDISGNVQGTITASSDTTPDAFTFTDQSNVALSSTIISNTITVSGINAGTSISITNGSYSINGGTPTNANGTVFNGDTVSVRHTSSGSFSTSVNTTLNIGGVTDTFTSTTLAADTTPNAFTFTDISNQNPNTEVVSNAITVSGINTGASISVTNGFYSINGGTPTNSTGTVFNGNTVTVRHTTSSAFNTSVDTTLNIGGITDTFTSTTRSPDVTPNAFTFTDITGQNPSTVVTSNTITVSGIEAAVNVSVTGGTVSINGGGFTTSGSVSNGGTVVARHTTSAAFNTNTDTTVTIGGISDTFTSTTRSPDTTADAFSFNNTTGAALNSTQTSNTVTITGLEPNYPFTVSSSGSAGALVDAGTVSLSGTYATSKSVTSSGSGQLVVSARVTASGSFGTNTSCTVSVGGQSATYTVTTLGADTTPDAFSFTTQSSVNPNTTIESNTITVSGLNTGTSISITGGEYSVNNGGYTSASGSGTIVNGDQIKVRHTSTTAFNTNTVTSLNIGGVVGTFTSTTRSPDTTPNAFSFTDATNAFAGTTYTSNTITVTGLEPNYSITVSCTGGQVDAGTSALSGTFATSKSVTTSGTGTLVVATNIVSSSTAGGSVNSIVTIGGVSDTYTVTTATNNVPNIFTFNPVSSVALSSLQTSNTITVGGLGGSSVTVSVTNGQYSKNGGGWNNPGTNTTAVDGDTFAVRHTSAATNNTNTDTTLFIGGRAGSFRSTTLAGTSGVYGVQISDSLGNITLDISDNTVKDFGTYFIGSVTANTTISGVAITDNTIALVTNNTGEGDTAIAPATVTLSPTADTITVSNGQAGFNIGIRLMEF